jgi:hypothetical protein
MTEDGFEPFMRQFDIHESIDITTVAAWRQRYILRALSSG